MCPVSCLCLSIFTMFLSFCLCAMLSVYCKLLKPGFGFLFCSSVMIFLIVFIVFPFINKNNPMCVWGVVVDTVSRFLCLFSLCVCVCVVFCYVFPDSCVFWPWISVCLAFCSFHVALMAWFVPPSSTVHYPVSFCVTGKFLCIKFVCKFCVHFVCPVSYFVHVLYL